MGQSVALRDKLIWLSVITLGGKMRKAILVFVVSLFYQTAYGFSPSLLVGSFSDPQDPSLASQRLTKISDEFIKGQLQIWDQGMTGLYLIRDSEIEFRVHQNSWCLLEKNKISGKTNFYQLIPTAEKLLQFESQEIRPNLIVKYRLIWEKVDTENFNLFIELQECPTASSACRPALVQFYFLKKK